MDAWDKSKESEGGDQISFSCIRPAPTFRWKLLQVDWFAGVSSCHPGLHHVATMDPHTKSTKRCRRWLTAGTVWLPGRCHWTTGHTLRSILQYWLYRVTVHYPLWFVGRSWAGGSVNIESLASAAKSNVSELCLMRHLRRRLVNTGHVLDLQWQAGTKQQGSGRLSHWFNVESRCFETQTSSTSFWSLYSGDVNWHQVFIKMLIVMADLAKSHKNLPRKMGGNNQLQYLLWLYQHDTIKDGILDGNL